MDNANSCLVKNDGDPNQCISFSLFGLEKYLLDNINKCKYAKLTPVQLDTIPAIIDGYDLIGYSPDGSGKKAAYMIPIVDKLLKDNQHINKSKLFAVIIAPNRYIAYKVFPF